MPRLEHVGIAVDAVSPVVDCLRDLLSVTPYKAETVTQQNVRTHFLDAGSTKLELLESLEPDSPVGRYLEKRGEGLHHVAFEVENAESAMARLRRAGYRLLSEEPQGGADDKRIFFVHPKETHGVLVEFCETMPARWTPMEVPHRDGTLALYERGDDDRPTILILHGAAGSTLLDTAPLMRRLETAHHVIGVDFSGHGSSSLPPDGQLSLDRLADDVRAALDTLDVKASHLFGFSIGGAAALRVAQTSPDRVNRLATLSTHIDWTDRLAETVTGRLDLDKIRERDPARADALQSHHEEPGKLMRALRAFVGGLPKDAEQVAKSLSRVEHSTLVATLDEDPIAPVTAAYAFQGALPNARFSVLPGTRHELRAAPLAALTSLLDDHFAAP